MEYICGLIAGKLEVLADAHGQDNLFRKRKAISALFPYVIWQERDQESQILDLFLRFVKITKSVQFWWRHIEPSVKTLVDGTSHVPSNRALTLLSPYMPWGERDFGEDRARIWAAAASTVPKEEGIAPSVIDTLLQIASLGLQPPDLHSNTRSWLTLRPSLPPVCKGRKVGSRSHVVQMVRNLKDIEILKSYLLLIWSEWDCPYEDGYESMLSSIREDFSGIGMNSHRADLLQRLDHILEQLDDGLKHLQQHRPDLTDYDLDGMKRCYSGLKQELLGVDRATSGVSTCASSRLTTLFKLLTLAAMHRITPSR